FNTPNPDPLQLRTPQNFNKSLNLGLNHDTSLNLFDIDENDFEYDISYDQESPVEKDSLRELNFRPNTNLTHHANAYTYPEYIPTHPPSYQQHQFPPPHPLPLFLDPFRGHPLNSIPESVEHFFNRQGFQDHQIYAT